jgi:hypothetical protein
MQELNTLLLGQGVATRQWVGALKARSTNIPRAVLGECERREGVGALAASSACLEERM